MLIKPGKDSTPNSIQAFDLTVHKAGGFAACHPGAHVCMQEHSSPIPIKSIRGQRTPAKTPSDGSDTTPCAAPTPSRAAPTPSRLKTPREIVHSASLAPLPLDQSASPTKATTPQLGASRQIPSKACAGEFLSNITNGAHWPLLPDLCSLLGASGCVHLWPAAYSIKLWAAAGSAGWMLRTLCSLTTQSKHLYGWSWDWCFLLGPPLRLWVLPPHVAKTKTLPCYPHLWCVWVYLSLFQLLLFVI